MREPCTPRRRELFGELDPVSCRIETQGGTVYWLSQPDEGGIRWIVREQLKRSETDTMVVRTPSVEGNEPDLGDKFRGRLVGEVRCGEPFVLELKNREARLVSEEVVAVETGSIPEMIFR